MASSILPYSYSFFYKIVLSMQFLLWSLVHVGLFMCVSSFRNIPHIHIQEKRDNKDLWHGAEIQVVIEGNWTTYRVCSTLLILTIPHFEGTSSLWSC